MAFALVTWSPLLHSRTNITTDNWLDDWWTVKSGQQFRLLFTAVDGHAETSRVSESSCCAVNIPLWLNYVYMNVYYYTRVRTYKPIHWNSMPVKLSPSPPHPHIMLSPSSPRPHYRRAHPHPIPTHIVFIPIPFPSLYLPKRMQQTFHTLRLRI